ncbi:hypothetical protein [Halobellus clavatus]|uniref:Uncharacterized protein n=1 Tax=Halobellus clavatus TaxID=660517 RepID=A0A1H3J0S7_9EURY|nr:hypothetical protein [Halobellus clavatus]SDY33576.1 hypothetical protein SAMN04487946_111115 [Halobellus clavatus]
MAGDSSPSFNEPSDVAVALIEQAEELCPVHNHVTRVIGNLDISEQAFSDLYTKSNPRGFDFDAIIRTFLYQKICALL